MRLKLLGLILLALSAAVGAAWLLYRIFAHIPSCEKEYEYRVSRFARLPGSRQKKDFSGGKDIVYVPKEEAEQTTPIDYWEGTATEVMEE